MSKLTPREKKLLIFAVVLIGLVSIFWWGLRPAWEEYQELDKELSRSQRQYKKAMKAVMLEKDFKAKYEGYLQGYQELKSHYYSDMNEKEAMLKFLSYIEELIQESGVNIISKNTLGMAKVEGYPTLQVNILLRGTPQEMTELLVGIRNSTLAIDVERLRIESVKNKGVLQMKLILSTLLINEEGERNEK